MDDEWTNEASSISFVDEPQGAGISGVTCSGMLAVGHPKTDLAQFRLIWQYVAISDIRGRLPPSRMAAI